MPFTLPAGSRSWIVRVAGLSAALMTILVLSAGTSSAHSTPGHGHGAGHGWHHGHSRGHCKRPNTPPQAKWWKAPGWLKHKRNCAVAPVPTAAFSFTPAVPYAGDVVSFDASTSTGGTGKDDKGAPITGKIVKYDWDFGDGAVATETVPTTTHSFTTAGDYTVKLTVTNDAGKTASTTKPITVDTVPTPVPTASFTYTPLGPVATVPENFDGSGSSGGEDRGVVGTIVTYDWDFGDGSAAPDAGPLVSHTFMAEGVFNVSLTVTNDHNQTDTATLALTVAPAPTPVPTASFTYSPLSAVATRLESFDGSGSSGGEDQGVVGTIVKYDWDFGDGNTAPDAGPLVGHTYLAGGTFNVSLTVTNDHNQSDTATIALTVAPPPPPVDPNDGQIAFGSQSMTMVASTEKKAKPKSSKKKCRSKKRCKKQSKRC